MHWLGHCKWTGLEQNGIFWSLPNTFFFWLLTNGSTLMCMDKCVHPRKICTCLPCMMCACMGNGHTHILEGTCKIMASPPPPPPLPLLPLFVLLLSSKLKSIGQQPCQLPLIYLQNGKWFAIEFTRIDGHACTHACIRSGTFKCHHHNSMKLNDFSTILVFFFCVLVCASFRSPSISVVSLPLLPYDWTYRINSQ